MTGTILVAEDNPANLAMVREVLESAGHRVRAARDGELALASARVEAPDLFLLDIHMPKMDGYATCDAIKRDEVLADVPVIFLSGIDEAFNKVQAFARGGADYVAKPFHAEELLARVGVHLELYRSRRRIREDARRLEASLAELEETSGRLAATEKNIALATFISGIAHELNNPVNYVALGAEALDRNVSEMLSLARSGVTDVKNSDASRWNALVEETPQILDGIKLGADRTAKIVKSLKSLQQRVSPIESDVDLARLIERAITLAVEQSGVPGRLETDLTEGQVMHCNPERIVEMYFHLVSNAITASVQADAPYVRITMQRDADPGNEVLRTVIINNGPGIPPEIRSRVFDPFVTTNEAGYGTGLGLPVAVHVAEEHDGSIELVESRQDHTRFEVTLRTAAM